jgi:F0F1-type ATP synthase assembly protein I
MLNKWFVLSFLWQMSFFMLIATVLYYTLDEKSGFSAFLGGLAYSAPTFLANMYMQKFRGSNAHADVGRAYISNIYKLVITAGVLIFVFKQVDVNAGVFIACYCVGGLVQFVTSFFSLIRE